jgi:hypothetical protein
VWINPKFRDQVKPPTTPAEAGKRLATFARGDGVEMRVNLAEYQGRPYIALRVWERDPSGAWWPCKGKGCSVRISEAGELAEALKLAAGAGANDERPQSGRPGRPQRPDYREADLPKQQAGRQEFDEFAG